ncbi:hypothetical protein [Cellulomonas sp. P5_E12]
MENHPRERFHRQHQRCDDDQHGRALDGAVDEEKLGELLAVGTELDVLDFKATLDLSKDR